MALTVSVDSLIAQDDVASLSANVPPKKETLTEKVQRYETAGYQIGVNVTNPDLSFGILNSGLTPTVKPSLTAWVLDFDKNRESEEVCSCFNKTEEIANRLNARFGTDVFVAVDVSKMPESTAMFLGNAVGKTADWWETKFKSVIHLATSNTYWMTKDDDKRYATYDMTFTLMWVEYVNEKNGKQKFIVQTTAQVFNEDYEVAWDDSDEDWPTPTETTLAFVKENIGGPTDEELNVAFETSFKEKMDKFMDRV
ncbi:MAG: hypothetical protein GY816_06550 [Cytophagales bacterium]|nr:hypothetical protein [Cytophagales bacterium]